MAGKRTLAKADSIFLLPPLVVFVEEKVTNLAAIVVGTQGGGGSHQGDSRRPEVKNK